MSQRIIFAGTPEFAASSLQAILDNQQQLDCEVVAVYTQPDRKAGRGQKITASAVKQLALKHDLPVEQPLTFKKSVPEGMQAREVLASYHADVMVVAAYGLILPLGVLNTPKLGCINIHASLLPRWRGAAPIHRAILAGDKETGITIMQMDKGLDTGDMLYKVNCNIEDTDTSASLHDRLALLGGQAVVEVLANLENLQAKATPQDNAQANYADKLSKAEGKINWEQSADEIDTHIRGLQPWPVAYTCHADKTIRVHQASVMNPNTQASHSKTVSKAGTILDISKAGIQVQCGDGSILLTSMQWAGGKALSAEQVFNGKKLAVGEHFADETSSS